MTRRVLSSLIAAAMALPGVLLPSTPVNAIASIGLVSWSSWQEPSAGSPTAVHIVGQVINNTSANITLVKIPITLKDGSGTAIGSPLLTYATVSVLGPGELSPFELLVRPVPTTYASYDIGAITSTPATSQPYHQPLATSIDPCLAGDPAGEICGTVTNNGTIAVDGVGVTLTVLDSSNRTVAQDDVLIYDGSGALNAALAPAASGHFRIDRSGDPTGASVLALAEPDYPVDLNPVPLDLGGVNLGKSSRQDVTLRNTGALTVTVGSVAASPSSEFAATSDCPGAGLGPNLTCHLTVTFSPAATGARSGMLTITDDAAGSPQTMPLTGTGTAPHVTFSPSTTLDFGTAERAGAPGVTKSVILINDGTGSLSIAGVGTDNAPTFTGDRNSCPAAPTTLPAGSQCTINITFASNIAGPFDGHLVVTDDAGTGTQRLPLTAFASGPGDTVSPTSIDVHGVVLGQTSAPSTVMLTNNGNETLTISSITASGDFARQNHCGATLAAGASCTVDVTFSPTQTGDRTGSLTVSDNTVAGRQSVSLKGKGVISTLAFSSASLDFGSHGLGSSTVLTDRITNEGSATLVITNITRHSGDYTETDDCGTTPISLATGNFCTLSVTFKPTDGGTRTGTITITDNSQTGSDSLSLTGTTPVLRAMYTLDGYGGLHADAGSATMTSSAYWAGWKIARSAALLPDGTGGFVLDGYGGLHNFGSAAPESASSYFGWDIARDVALLPSSTAQHPKGYTLDGWGGLHPFGGAPAVMGNPYSAGQDVALRIVLLSDASGGGYVLDVYGGLHPFFVAGNAAPASITNNSYWPSWRIVRGVALDPNSTAVSVSGVTLDAYGGVHPFNSAGSVGTVDPQGPYFGGWDISRGVVLSAGSTAAKPQGWVLDGWGGLHAFGGAPSVSSGAYWPNFDIAVQVVLR